MSDNLLESTETQRNFNSLYDRRRRASLDDARQEAEAVVKAVSRISAYADEHSSPGAESLAAGKLFEIAGEPSSAETAYRRALAEDPDLDEAAARLVVVLTKLRRFDEALEIGGTLLLKSPTAVFSSLVYEGPLSACTVLGDVYRLSGNHTVAAGLYREAARLEGSTPYSVSQAVVTMALAGQGRAIAQFADEHSGASVGERIRSLIRLSRETDERFAIIQEVAARANIAAGESMLVDPLDLVAER
ncbi:tetratricopeptide repeat protein [Nonomuraea lactucae]|uniref:tetratricopeptide repeat protein n=1 Tax=Nonomuraea lactucae TaxID=2249762 RepID=UPI0013B4051F|nr:tetratricopeptide repeat protein [Nonomuraea lactucae]